MGAAGKPRPKDRILFLETQLDHSLASVRSEIRFMRDFLENFPNVELEAREIHSKADLEKFLEEARHRPHPKVVHIVSHGGRYKGKAALVLTDDEIVDLDRARATDLFRDLNVEALFLSCCVVGADRKLMRSILDRSGVLAVFSYARDVTDYQAFIAESLFYHLAYGWFRGARSDLSFREVYERLKIALDYLGVDDFKRPLVEPLIVAEFAEEA